MPRRLLVISIVLVVGAFLAISAAAVGMADPLRPEFSANSPGAPNDRHDSRPSGKSDRLPSLVTPRAMPSHRQRQ